MKRISLIIVVLFFFTVHSNSQTDWQVLNSGVIVNLYGVYFTNINTGYVCGASGTILKTTNAGSNWNLINSSVSYQLNDICFANDITGYCSGNSGIIKTTNAGVNWFSVFSGNQMNKIQCIGNVIYSGGQNGIYKSTDSGQNWINTVSGYSGTIRGLCFLNADTGYGMGSIADQRRTTNGGSNWIGGLYWGPGDYSFGECYFFNSGSGFAGCSFNSGYPNYYSSYSIYKANTWSSWYQVYSSAAMGIGGITFTGNDTGYAVGGGWTGSAYQSLILKTINGGNNWVTQNYTISQILQDVYFLDSKKGYAVGRGGIILKTENGGTIGINKISTGTPLSFSLFQNYPNPFNPVTKIKFDIPSNVKRQTANVKLIVYDILGKEIQTLINEQLQSGMYEVTFDGSNLPSGVYFYQLRVGDFVGTKKLILLK